MQQNEETATYYFRAVTPEGSVYAGQLDANSQNEVLQKLRLAGYLPLSVKNKPIRRSILQREIEFGGSRKLNSRECERFCRELSILLNSSLELSRSIEVIETAAEPKSKIRQFCTGIRQGLRLGRGFTESVAQSGFELPREFVPVLEVGESTGSLARSVTLLAQVFDEKSKFKGMFVSAFIYPAFLMFVAVMILGVLAFFVAPNLAVLFDSTDKPLPPILAILNAVSFFITNNAYAILAFAVTLVVFAFAISKTTMINVMVQRTMFGLPLIGKALLWSSIQRFAVTLHLYVSSNSPIAPALVSAIQSAGFPNGKSLGERLAVDIRKGRSLSSALLDISILPRSVTSLIQVGEESGRLEEVLAAVQADAAGRFKRSVDLISAVLAPALILLVGAVIGGVIFSVFSALLEINELAF